MVEALSTAIGKRGRPAFTIDLDHYESVMRHVFEVKRVTGDLARAYANGVYGPVIRYVRDLWGFAPTYLLEDYPLDVERGASSTVLAAFIAEQLMIYQRHRKMNHVIISIVGLGGAGKTTYAVLSCIGAYLLAGFDWKTAVKLTAESAFFNLEPFIRGIRTIVEGNLWVPCIVADDIGEWIPKYWRDLRMMGAIDFFKLLEQAKDWNGVMIFTARSFEGSVASNIRQKSDIIVEAREEILDMHRLSIFQWYLARDWSPKDTRQKLRRMMHLDPVPATLKMPDEIWRHMRNVRRQLAKTSIEKLGKFAEYMKMVEEKILRELDEKYRSGDGS